jgi:hypothetical protein
VEDEDHIEGKGEGQEIQARKIVNSSNIGEVDVSEKDDT